MELVASNNPDEAIKRKIASHVGYVKSINFSNNTLYQLNPVVYDNTCDLDILRVLKIYKNHLQSMKTLDKQSSMIVENGVQTMAFNMQRVNCIMFDFLSQQQLDIILGKPS